MATTAKAELNSEQEQKLAETKLKKAIDRYYTKIEPKRVAVRVSRHLTILVDEKLSSKEDIIERLKTIGVYYKGMNVRVSGKSVTL